MVMIIETDDHIIVIIWCQFLIQLFMIIMSRLLQPIIMINASNGHAMHLHNLVPILDSTVGRHTSTLLLLYFSVAWMVK